MKFIYQARTKEGKQETGTVEASSKERAASLLQKYNITVVSLKEEKSPFSLKAKISFFRRVNKKELAVFSRQLAVMLEARVPVVQSLASLAAQTGKIPFREKIIEVSKLVEEGNTLSEAFANFPEVFDNFFVSLLKSGEASGKISESLYYLSDHLEREYDIASKIKGAMIYPVLVLFVMAVVIIVVMTFVMPKIINILTELGSKPPLTTRILIAFYNFTAAYGWIMLLIFVALVAYLIYYFRTPQGRKTYDIGILKVPLIGGFLQKTYIVRMVENLSTLISSGLPITLALKITKNTIRNFVYRDIVAETEKEVSQGEKISTVLMRHPDRMPLFIVQMVKVGEQTGKLDRSLMEIATFYQKEVDRLVDNFMTLIEPLLIIFLGAGVAFLAISVITPLYGMLGSI